MRIKTGTHVITVNDRVGEALLKINKHWRELEPELPARSARGKAAAPVAEPPIADAPVVTDTSATRELEPVEGAAAVEPAAAPVVEGSGAGHAGDPEPTAA